MIPKYRIAAFIIYPSMNYGIGLLGGMVKDGREK
jgi:hypothetical protein